MSKTNIDLSAIRPLNGARTDGFEELCAQLARIESPANSHFVRKGTPDAGVECYAVLEDGSEWGWQSKYFDSFGPSQWQQLDESVETVLAKHSNLVRYFVCVPLNRPDARIPGRQSALESWGKHVSKWQGWAATKGMNVEFTYWGESEILYMLAQPAHLGRVSFWFDTQAFDKEWFAARLKDAIDTAGARYTAELNLSLPIAEKFEFFGRTTRFFDSIKGLAKDIRENYRRLYPNQKVLENKEIGEAYQKLTESIQTILPSIGRVQVQPVGELPFEPIIQQISLALQLTDEIGNLLSAQAFKPKATGKQGKYVATDNNPYQDLRSGIHRLDNSLSVAQRRLEEAIAIANRQLMVMTGPAGCGKTHLLCDVATNRINEGRPTVLLMGQRFIGSGDPWMQALQQLDLATVSVEEVIGALESAAQVADCRLLLLVDAINEGNGRAIWPSNIASFVTQVVRSPWVGVVFSVRSSYEKPLVPAGLLSQAYRVVHRGFTGLEYNATKSFFIHYGLELPSTPLLAPEFRNPLFLKTLCKGLKLTKQRRLPRGFHGITSAFNLYLDGVNEVLAVNLDYNPRQNLVRKALEAFAQVTASSDERWLTLTDATAVVDKLLPGRSHTQSLYHGLVAEGILTEEASRRSKDEHEEVVNISYERLADHLLTNILLDLHLDLANPASSFEAGKPLTTLYDLHSRYQEGTVEALFIQVPERTGRELSELAPDVVTDWHGRAFRQSIIWRKTTAFSAATRQALRDFDTTDGETQQTLDVILTVASLPEHPFNAEFLDMRLRKDTMPERDAWWSIGLHYMWDTQSAVDRLVDWSSGITANMNLDSQSVDLCAITLAWLLTTSNRFLRDRATKGLTNLLTGRLEAATRLVERFADVDDLYVAERVYAAAYGATMRSYDRAEVGELAMSVYTLVFVHESPPVHILLRDYARGIIERAIYLQAELAVDVNLVRPPYRSTWPAIPTEEEIEQLFPGSPANWKDDDGGAWAHDRIKSSVMADDFGRYVIDPKLDDWMSVLLSEPAWVKPKNKEELFEEFAQHLSEHEKTAWISFQEAETALKDAQYQNLKELIAKQKGTSEYWTFIVLFRGTAKLQKLQTQAIALAQAEQLAYELALQVLEHALTEEHAQQLTDIMNQPPVSDESRRAPQFDEAIAKRYVVNRVLELGWSPELFGYFDKQTIGYRGREANKAERIGKKYQWIALHEIMACIADHYRFHERFSSDEERVTAYEGPWQPGARNLDPSNVLRTTATTSSWSSHDAAWWAPQQPRHWGEPDKPKDWLAQWHDLPAVEKLLLLKRPEDGNDWLNLDGHFNWSEPVPPDLESSDVERKQIWYIVRSYLVRESETPAFLKWAETDELQGRDMPEPTQLYTVFLGEHGWSPASQYYQRESYNGEVWRRPRNDCPVEVQVFSFDYLNEQGTFDCSLDDTISLNMPRAELIDPLDLQWTGTGADFTHKGQLVAFDPTVHQAGPGALLVREDFIRAFLAREKLSLCWVIIGEKQIIGSYPRGNHHGRMNLSGAYTLSEQGLDGFLNCYSEGVHDGQKDDVLLNTIRTC